MFHYLATICRYPDSAQPEITFLPPNTAIILARHLLTSSSYPGYQGVSSPKFLSTTRYAARYSLETGAISIRFIGPFIMDPANILPSLERLDDAVDNLEEALQPLVNNMADVASKLPLLDKAKFYVLMTYSIESMLFSALRLNGVDAKEHAVFKELARVRQYFDKIKNIEFPPQKPEQSLNKEAAIRLSVSPFLSSSLFPSLSFRFSILGLEIDALTVTIFFLFPISFLHDIKLNQNTNEEQYTGGSC